MVFFSSSLFFLPSDMCGWFYVVTIIVSRLMQCTLHTLDHA